MSQLHPKIYVVCLAAHHSSKLHGEWIDANQAVTALEQAVQKIIASSPVRNAKAWAIHDQEDFGAVRLSEHENLETVAEMATFIAKEGELGTALVNELADVYKAKYALEEDYFGAYDSEKDFAIQFFDDLSGINALMSCYIDYESFASDIFAGDFFALEVGGKTHVFGH